MDFFHESSIFYKTIMTQVVCLFPVVDSKEKEARIFEKIRPFIKLLISLDDSYKTTHDISPYVDMFNQFLNQIKVDKIDLENLLIRIDNHIKRINYVYSILFSDCINYYCCDFCSSDSVTIDDIFSTILLFDGGNTGEKTSFSDKNVRSYFSLRDLKTDSFCKKQEKHSKDLERHARNKGLISGDRPKRMRDSGISSESCKSCKSSNKTVRSMILEGVDEVYGPDEFDGFESDYYFN
jgi:hypothetical protein